MNTTKNDMLNQAIIFATTEHARIGQVRDGSGLPYITHPLAVMGLVKSIDEKIVAVLHDTIEDVPTVTAYTLRMQGFSEHIVDAVDAISKRVGEKQNDYLDRVKANKTALHVKYADVQHNLSDFRGIEHGTKKRWMKKYHETLDYLER